MVCFDTTFPKGRICRYTHRNIWTRLLGNSTSGHARRWSSQLRQKHLMHVLHRPVEPADLIIHIIWALTYRRTPRDLASHCRLVCGAFMPRKLRHFTPINIPAIDPRHSLDRLVLGLPRQQLPSLPCQIAILRKSGLSLAPSLLRVLDRPIRSRQMCTSVQLIRPLLTRNYFLAMINIAIVHKCIVATLQKCT